LNCYDLPGSYNIQTSGGQVPNSQCGGPSSTSDQSMWDFWWTKWPWGRFYFVSC